MSDRQVGIIFFTKNEKDELCFVLNKRGDFNFEKNTPESFPGCFQVTCYGSVKPEEDYPDALLREAIEELGKDFVDLFFQELTYFLGRIALKTSTVEMVIYQAIIPSHWLTKLRPETGSGGFCIFPANAISKFIPTTERMRNDGAPTGYLAMREEEIIAVRDARDKILFGPVRNKKNYVLPETVFPK